MTDLIDRQQAIDKLNDEYHGTISDEGMKIYQIIKWLNELPSIQPKRKGQWIQLTCDSAEWWYCSECNEKVQMNPWMKYNYCPNCGADMRGDKHETD